MAAFTVTPLRVTDSNGNPISGGKLRLRNAGTTDLTDIYTTAAFGTPLANPVVADSAGWLPMIYAPDGTLVDGAFLTAGDAVLSGQSFSDVEFVGSDNATLSRDFTNSRFQVRGAAGTIHVEAGDPTGDDSGGTMRIGGWSSTQGDALDLDFADVDISGTLDVASTFTVASQPVDSVLATGTASAVSTLDIPLTGTLYRYTIEIIDLISSAAATLQMRLAFDSTPTFKTGASDYYAVYEQKNTTTVNRGGGAAGQITLSGNQNMNTAERAAVTLDIYSTSSTTSESATYVDSIFRLSNGGSLLWVVGSASVGTTYGRATYVRLLASSGTFSCKWRLISGRGF